MKKVIGIAVAVLLGLSLLGAYAESVLSTNVYTNSLGSVITYIVTDSGVRAISATVPLPASAAAERSRTFDNVQVYDGSANVDTTAAATTPRDFGDILLCSVSNRMFIAITNSGVSASGGWTEIDPKD